MISLDNENKNFTVAMISNQIFQNSCESSSKKDEAGPKMYRGATRSFSGH